MSEDPLFGSATIEVEDIFHMAACAECYGDALPFGDPDARDEWISRHTTATGHHVSTSTEMRGHSTSGRTTLYFYPLTT